MYLLGRTLTVVGVVLNGFLALTAFGGGIAILTGAAGLEPAQLEGSPFLDYTIPGLVLLIVVGGIAVLATVLFARRSLFALPTATAAGIAIMAFEFVEVLVIGSPPGPALALQLFYYALGLLIALDVLAIWLVELRRAEG